MTTQNVIPTNAASANENLIQHLQSMFDLPAVNAADVLERTATDYRKAVAPYVPAIRDVLEGNEYRTKVEWETTGFHFFHGCLMVQVKHEGRLYSLPPFGLNEDNTPYIQTLPEHKAKWLEEFMSLPKSVLMFYFMLMKETFNGYALKGRIQNPVSGKNTIGDVPEAFADILAAVEWNTVSAVAA